MLEPIPANHDHAIPSLRSPSTPCLHATHAPPQRGDYWGLVQQALLLTSLIINIPFLLLVDVHSDTQSSTPLYSKLHSKHSLKAPSSIPTLKASARPSQIGDYWGWYGKRFYHHTGPVSTFYAMREAMALVAEEGLDKMWCV